MAEPMKSSPWSYAVALFERVYTSHPGPEPEAFKAASEIVGPLIPAVREQIGFKKEII